MFIRLLIVCCLQSPKPAFKTDLKKKYCILLCVDIVLKKVLDKILMQFFSRDLRKRLTLICCVPLNLTLCFLVDETQRVSE